MQFSKRLSVPLAITAFLFASTSFAQQDDKALLQGCLQAQAQEFLPLADERIIVFQEFSSRATSISSILSWLEDDYKTADAKRIREINLLETRLQALQQNANLTSAKTTKDVAALVETANAMLEKIGNERDEAIKPISRKLTALQRKYRAQEVKLDPVIMALFREQGDAELTSGLSKSYGSFSYSSGASSATYKRDDEIKSTAICYIYLFNKKAGNPKYGKFLDKYPVAYRSKSQLEVLIGRTRVTIFTSDKKLGGKHLDETLSSLVDIEKLESMLTP